MVFTSIGVGSVARAAESTCCVDAASGVAAADSDGCGKAPADCDKNCAHHGTCHGHHVAAATATHADRTPRLLAATPAMTVVAALTPADLETSLRPPRA